MTNDRERLLAFVVMSLCRTPTVKGARSPQCQLVSFIRRKVSRPFAEHTDDFRDLHNEGTATRVAVHVRDLAGVSPVCFTA
jgi:hypothetical protein